MSTSTMRPVFLDSPAALAFVEWGFMRWALLLLGVPEHDVSGVSHARACSGAPCTMGLEQAGDSPPQEVDTDGAISRATWSCMSCDIGTCSAGHAFVSQMASSSLEDEVYLPFAIGVALQALDEDGRRHAFCSAWIRRGMSCVGHVGAKGTPVPYDESDSRGEGNLHTAKWCCALGAQVPV